MTILFFSRLFYPHIGGVEKHVLEVGKRLVKKNHKVIVVTEGTLIKDIPVYQSTSMSAKVTGEVDGIKIHRIPVGRKQNQYSRHAGLSSISHSRERFWVRSAYQNDVIGVVAKDTWFKKFKIWWWLWQHKDLIKNADIIHCHDVFFWYLPFRFIYPNKKVYITFHGYETKFPPSKKAILIRKISEWLSWGNICVGDYIKKWYGTKSDYVTYGAVDLKTQNSKLKTQNYSSKLKILFIGRLEEDTGVLIYLKALELMRQKKISFEFEACGNGSLRGEVERYGMVYGFVKDIGKYIVRSDFVFTSSYLSILEAISRGKIVFSVFQNKLKEDYLKMSPFAKWIIIENSPEKIIEKIHYFMKHQKEKKEILDIAYSWVKMQTWEKVISIYLQLWK